jgi:hypothetical protein
LGKLCDLGLVFTDLFVEFGNVVLLLLFLVHDFLDLLLLGLELLRLQVDHLFGLGNLELESLDLVQVFS